MRTSTLGARDRLRSQGRLRSTSGVRSRVRIRNMRESDPPIMASASTTMNTTPEAKSRVRPGGGSV